ncbi:uncharacterized protein LOC105354953 isoform X1 [Oryzias latipes]|uniref:uncharacterized protein LOC105354953 isoform X1 n=2 Tax=Oryzias latipes TaxID=8090 RepID=UPI0005CC3A8A|nr:uncharacterized protein LOC105354953 isoform X1 [Oryzias latipes]
MRKYEGRLLRAVTEEKSEKSLRRVDRLNCAEMTSVIGLLLMLITVTDGVVTHCDGRKNGAQCYGALGGTVSLQLMDNFSQIPRYELFMVLSGGKDKPLYIQDRSSFFPSNGTFWIHNLSRNDSCQYRLTTFDSYGRITEDRILQLSVQAPVSSVSLVSECLSQGEMKVSCSSEGGDSPQYKWTLNGKSLTEAELLSGNKQTNIITLKQHVSGRLVCSSWNHVSSASKEININNCGFIYINCTFNGTKISKWVFQENNTLCVEPPTTVSPTETQITVVHTGPSVLRCSLMFLFSVVSFVGICVYFKWKKIKSEKAEQFAARHRRMFSDHFYENEQALYINIQPNHAKVNF